MDMQVVLWSLIVQTDTVTKFVLIFLMLISVACWSLVIYKWIIFNAKLKNLKKALNLVAQASSFEELCVYANSIQDSFAGKLLLKYIAEFKYMLSRCDNLNLSKQESIWNDFQDSIGRLIDDVIYEDESGFSFISTSAAVSTLIGLFGTVWGLIHAFIGIATKKNADISAVAPGIAEALITTMAGLVVAIPGLCMYSFLNFKIKSVEKNIMTLSDKAIMLMKNSFNDTLKTFQLQQSMYSSNKIHESTSVK